MPTDGVICRQSCVVGEVAVDNGHEQGQNLGKSQSWALGQRVERPEQQMCVGFILLFHQGMSCAFQRPRASAPERFWR